MVKCDLSFCELLSKKKLSSLHRFLVASIHDNGASAGESDDHSSCVFRHCQVVSCVNFPLIYFIYLLTPSLTVRNKGLLLLGMIVSFRGNDTIHTTRDGVELLVNDVGGRQKVFPVSGLDKALLQGWNTFLDLIGWCWNNYFSPPYNENVCWDHRIMWWSA